MTTSKKKLMLNRSTVRHLSLTKLELVGGGPGHGTTNRCIDYSWPTWCDSCAQPTCATYIPCYSVDPTMCTNCPSWYGC